MTAQSKQTDIFKTEFSEDDQRKIAFSCAFREGDIKKEIRDQRLRLRANSFDEKQQQEKFIRKLESPTTPRGRGLMKTPLRGLG